jgi:hypothetical protein
MQCTILNRTYMKLYVILLRSMCILPKHVLLSFASFVPVGHSQVKDPYVFLQVATLSQRLRSASVHSLTSTNSSIDCKVLFLIFSYVTLIIRKALAFY